MRPENIIPGNNDYPDYLRPKNESGESGEKNNSRIKKFLRILPAVLAVYAGYSQLNKKGNDYPSSTVETSITNREQKDFEPTPHYSSEKLQEKIKSILMEAQSSFDKRLENKLAKLKKIYYSNPLTLRKIKRNNNEKIGYLSVTEFIGYSLDALLSLGKLDNINEQNANIYKDALIGIAVQESKLDKKAISKSNALGMFQIMPITWQDNVGDDMPWKIRLDPERSTHEKGATDRKIATFVAINHLDKRIIPAIKLYAYELADILDYDPEDKERFLAYFAVNAYNAGQNTIKQILAKTKKYLESLKNSTDPRDRLKFNYYKTLDPLSFFLRVTELAQKEKWSKYYGKEASNYVFLTIVGLSTLDELNLNKPLSDYAPVFQINTLAKQEKRANKKG